MLKNKILLRKNYGKSKAFVQESVEYIAGICKNKPQREELNALQPKRYKTIRIALSGGSTPKPIYSALAKRTDIDWRHVEFFQVDERYVPANHPDSNQRMIRETFISRINPKKFHFFDTSLPIEKSLKKYAKELDGNWTFDLCILGIGEDGHIASLFPGEKALKERNHPVAHTQTKKFAMKDRLTLTFPPILASKKILVLLKGKEKIIKALQKDAKTTEQFPAMKLKDHKNVIILIFTGIDNTSDTRSSRFREDSYQR